MSDAGSRRSTALLVAAALAVTGVSLAQRTDRAPDGSPTTAAAAAAPSRPAPPPEHASAFSRPAPATTAPPTSVATTAPPTTGATTAPPPQAPVLTAIELTSEGRDRYEHSAVPSPDGLGLASLDVSAPPTNTGQGMRYVVWDPASPVAVDQGACATWTGTNDSLQQGFALRISTPADGGWRAITVTKNIVFETYWRFNVHVWDTRHQPTFTTVDSVVIDDLFFHQPSMPPFPWHVCARAVGSQVSFKVWLPGEPEPSWTDSTAGATVDLPPGWVAPGRSGWYAGHVPPGRTGHYDDLGTTDLTPNPNHPASANGWRGGTRE